MQMSTRRGRRRRHAARRGGEAGGDFGAPMTCRNGSNGEVRGTREREREREGGREEGGEMRQGPETCGLSERRSGGRAGMWRSEAGGGARGIGRWSSEAASVRAWRGSRRWTRGSVDR